MMKKLFKIEWISTVVLIISVFVLGFTLKSGLLDVSRVRQNMAERNLSKNSIVYGKYFDNQLSSRIEVLDNLAETVSKNGLTDPKKIGEILVAQKMFDRMTLVDANGDRLWGDAYDGKEFTQPEIYNSLEQGKNTVGQQIREGADGKNELRFYAPIRRNGKLVMALVGAILERNINVLLRQADYVGDGCLCVIDSEGEYIIGDSNYDTMLADKESNHFYHIENANVTNDDMSSEILQEKIQDRKVATVDYKYAGNNYIAEYTPITTNNWYLVVTIPAEQVGSNMPVLTSETVILGVFSLLALIATVILLVLLILKNLKMCAENQRHTLLEKCDDCVIFQLTFKPHKLEFYGDVKRVTGTDIGVLSGEAVYDVYDWIHEDDASLRGRLNAFWEGEEDIFSTEVRVRNIKEGYSWYRLTGALEREISGNVKSFTGKLVNVDREFGEEKELIQRAENDLLTGVLNKKTMEKRIALMLKNRGSKYVIFYMVDLDNFKNVNDTLGHIYGDQAIVETAQCLNKVFANQDCIGRLGGDEFAVCVSYLAFDRQALLDFISKKAEEICAANRRTYSDGASDVSISSSVGVAYAPDMGESFEALYTKADKALYISKKNGKNQYHIYTPEDENK